MRCWLVLVLFVAGCLESNLVVCDDGRACPAGMACDDRHASCVDPDQVSVCAGRADGDPCTTAMIADGVCFGVCIPAGCSNGEVEPGELCDDGNAVSGDGCAADCNSEERCGDGFVDRNRGEDCDDGNARGHDGCSSTCAFEEKRWVQHGTLPPGRAYAAVAYDSIRRRVVAFGGENAAGIFRDTWEWDGASWVAMAPVFAPPARTNAQMAFDPIRRRIVMFGGSGELGIPLSDTWEWDGTTWTAQPSLMIPPERAGATMVWNPTLRAVVLFGGTTFFRVYNDTWTWDGEAWARVEPATLPTARLNHAMAFDIARNRMVIVGGVDGSAQPVLDSWVFDGTWTQLASAPPHLHDVVATYDPLRAKVVYVGLDNANTWKTWELDDDGWAEVLASGQPVGVIGTDLVFDLDARKVISVFGCDRGGAYTTAMAGWNGGTWSAIVPQTVPAPRFHCGLALDPGRDRFVMFGGCPNIEAVGAACDGVTWEWDGVHWTQPTTTGPAKRLGHAMVFDGHEVLLFGGTVIGNAATNETWTWNGQTWTQRLVTPSPPVRQFAAMAFDSARGRAVLFGGTADSNTWEWDGTRWYDVTPVVTPPPRDRTAMAYDAKRHRVVLFGGTSGVVGADLEEVWEWDGATWTNIPTPLRPEARYGHQLIYDPIRERIVLLSGVPLLSFSEWEWDGMQWTQPSSTNTPFPRQGMCAAYDPTRSQIVGFSGGFYETFAEHWTVAYNGADEEVCLSGIDGDNDTRVGCADEDCSFVCTGCGDGTCGPTENDRLCPSDCAASTPICGDSYCSPGEAATCASDC